MKRALLLALSLGVHFSAAALDYFPSRGSYSVKVKSFQEQLFGDVYRQQYDFSCGSAAVASLLSFHYETESSESTIFEYMFKHGDKEKIERQGFSMLDMKNYLNSIGFDAEGYNIPLEKLQEIKIPGITIVNFDGYMHFVVIKGINSKNVILGDPSRGTVVMKKEEFKNYFKGAILLVKNKADIGRKYFITKENYSVYASSPTSDAITRDSLSTFSITLPGSNDY